MRKIYTLSAIEFLQDDNVQFAREYVAERALDCAELMSFMKWSQNSKGVLRCEIYGQSLLWDIERNALHAGDWCAYEMLDLNEKGSDIECFAHIEQFYAYILKRFW